jgi:hypothetical protein
LNFVCFDTTSTTDLAAPSGLIVEPHPLTNTASTAARISNARGIVAVFQISGNATRCPEPATVAPAAPLEGYDPGMGYPAGLSAVSIAAHSFWEASDMSSRSEHDHR